MKAFPAVAVRGPVLVTGTDTGVGKTIVTAAIAAAATARGLRVAVVKPAQTGVVPGAAPGVAPGGDEEPDADVVARLAAPAVVRTLATYPDPLAPATAARISGLPGLAVADVVRAVQSLADSHDLVLIEGAGGLLVPMGPADPVERPDWTVAELAVLLSVPAIVVARAGLGTLNHTALTLEALSRRDIQSLVVIGAWPATPSLVHQTNLRDLPGQLSGVLPAGAGALVAADFRRAAPSWLAPTLHGHWTRR